MTTRKRHVGGVLLLHASRATSGSYAGTVAEHINAFRRYLRAPVTSVNTRLPFPTCLRGIEFDVLLLHYSLFGDMPYELHGRFVEYVGDSRSYKIAFFQDEYRFCQERRTFIAEAGIRMVYTLVEPRFHDAVYGGLASVDEVVHTLPGYVSDEMLSAARRHARPLSDRSVAVGYRGRSLPFYLGAAGQEKSRIARGFDERTRDLGLVIDVSADPADRIYGDAWYRFLGNCRCVLGVEGGASAFDLRGEVYRDWVQMTASNPSLTFEEFATGSEALGRWDYKLPSLMLTPRHLEAAALGSCQILFPGRFSDLLEPHVHYLPLERDFSNLGDILRQMRDDRLIETIAGAAHRDLVASGALHYSRLVRDFEQRLVAADALNSRGGRHVRLVLRSGQEAQMRQRRVLANARQWQRSQTARGRAWLARIRRTIA